MIAEQLEFNIIPKERALIVLEDEKSAEPVAEVEVKMPKMFEIWQMPSDGAPLPISPNPYYPLAKEGLYLHRKLLIGHGYIPQKEMPQNLKSIGDAPRGMFTWTAPIIPAEICASIVHFFKRIYEKQKTEAEVLLLFNHKTLEWKVFIPTQQVSHGGVKSVYEPADIPKGFTVVGTMHSHCDFSAFHSSIDTGDAATFDGVHLTIGHIMDEKPEVVAMVMMNKIQFNYGNVADVADFSNLEAATAPEEWDEFVQENSALESTHKPRGFELFDKYKEPPKPSYYTPSTYTPNQRNSSVPGYGNWPASHGQQRYWTDLTDEEWDSYLERRYPSKGSEQSLWEKVKKDSDDNTKITSIFRDEYWEDGLPDKLSDMILDSGVITEDDIDHVTEHVEDGLNIMWWRTLFLKKLGNSATILNALGLEVNYHIAPKKLTKGDK